MDFDLVFFTCAEGVDGRSPRNVIRVAYYQSLAKAMIGKGKVLVVPHYVSVIPELLTDSRRFCRRAFRGVRREAENLFIFAPTVPVKLGPLANRPFLIKRALGHLGADLAAALKTIGCSNRPRVVIADDPFHLMFLGLVGESVAAYECIDDYSLYGGVAKQSESVLAFERAIAKKCDAVFSTSTILMDRFASLNANTYYLPNAVDFEHFNRATSDVTPIAAELAGIPKPVVGFVGNLNFWYDFDLLREVISRRPHWSFVFVGAVTDYLVAEGLAGLRALPNTYFLGWQDSGVLPSFMKGFDAAIMPYVLDKATMALSPDKMYQYLAAGLPVVSTPIAAATELSEVVAVAPTADDFLRSLENAIHHDTLVSREARLQIARNQTWDQRAIVQTATLERLLEGQVLARV